MSAQLEMTFTFQPRGNVDLQRYGLKSKSNEMKLWGEITQTCEYGKAQLSFVAGSQNEPQTLPMFHYPWQIMYFPLLHNLQISASTASFIDHR